MRKPVWYRSVIFILVMAACAVFAPGKPPADELYLSVTMVTGEHSRDSNSTTTSLTLTADTLRYEQGYHGTHSGARAPVKKEYKLTREDQSALKGVLREKNLLVNRTLSALSEEQSQRRYFELEIRSKLNGKEHSISIDGPRSATKLKDDRIYQDSVYLIEQLYKIINKTDAEVRMPELID